MKFDLSWGLLVLSFVANLGLIVHLIRSRKKPIRRYDMTAEQMLHDMTVYGASMIKVQRVDPDSVYFRSPTKEK